MSITRQFLFAAAIAVAFLALGCGDPPEPTATSSAPQAPRLRWVNISIDKTPDEGGRLRVARHFPISPDYPEQFSDRFYISIDLADSTDEDPPRVIIDARTGGVLKDTLTADDVEAVALLATLAIESDYPAVWPFVDGQPPPSIGGNANAIEFPPESGIMAGSMISYCREPDCSLSWAFQYGDARLVIGGMTGTVLQNTADEREVVEAFDRIIAHVTS